MGRKIVLLNFSNQPPCSSNGNCGAGFRMFTLEKAINDVKLQNAAYWFLLIYLSVSPICC